MSKHLWVGISKEQPELCSLSVGTCVAYTAGMPGAEADNQDGLLVYQREDGGIVLAVADGVGGSKSGQEASKLALGSMAEALAKESETSSIRSAIIDGFEAANRAVLATSLGAATTLAVVEIVDNVVRSYHAGDSFVFLVGQRGRQRYQTIDHGPVGYGVEAGIISTNAALKHDQRHVVSNVVGFEQMRIDIGPPVKLNARDTLIIATDGLSDNLSVDEIADCVRVGKLDEGASSLADKCRQRMLAAAETAQGKPDDTTFVLFRASKSR